LQDIQNTLVAASSDSADTILMRVDSVCFYNASIRGMSSAFGWNWLYVAAVTGVKKTGKHPATAASVITAPTTLGESCKSSGSSGS
jgi:hypothetical protein